MIMILLWHTAGLTNYISPTDNYSMRCWRSPVSAREDCPIG